MAISTLGPAELDPFAPTTGPVPEENHDPAPQDKAREAVPLPEGLGTQIDTSA